MLSLQKFEVQCDAAQLRLVKKLRIRAKNSQNIGQ